MRWHVTRKRKIRRFRARAWLGTKAKPRDLHEQMDNCACDTGIRFYEPTAMAIFHLIQNSCWEDLQISHLRLLRLLRNQNPSVLSK